jgi:hypothetical protein
VASKKGIIVQNELAQNESTQNELAQNESTSWLILNKPVSSKRATIKDKIRIYNSLSPISLDLEKYFKSLSESNAEREIFKFKELRQIYSEEEIVLCMKFLQQNGDMNGKSVVKYMSFLTHDITRSLPLAKIKETECKVQSSHVVEAAKVESEREARKLLRDQLYDKMKSLSLEKQALLEAKANEELTTGERASPIAKLFLEKKKEEIIRNGFFD